MSEPLAATDFRSLPPDVQSQAISETLNDAENTVINAIQTAENVKEFVDSNAVNDLSSRWTWAAYWGTLTWYDVAALLDHIRASVIGKIAAER